MEEQQAINSEIIKNKIPDENTIDALANLFKMFGDSTRAKILSCLQVKSLYVYEIADILNMSSSAVSHHEVFHILYKLTLYPFISPSHIIKCFFIENSYFSNALSSTDSRNFLGIFI